MHLGIEAQTGAIFEGRNNPDLHVRPQPPVSQCHLVRSEADWQNIPSGLSGDADRWAFREDTFDSVTRIRRGRVYQSYGNSQPQMVVTYRPPQQDLLSKPDPRPIPQLSMYHYIACTALLAVPNRAYGLTLVVGSGTGTSAYSIVQMEQMINGDVMVTLKERSALGVIPELNEAAVPPSSLKPVRQALEERSTRRSEKRPCPSSINAATRWQPCSATSLLRKSLTRPTA